MFIAGQIAGHAKTMAIGVKETKGGQGQKFARHLEAAGVPTASSFYEGVMREFFGAAAVLEKADQA
jgi:acetyl esterase